MTEAWLIVVIYTLILVLIMVSLPFIYKFEKKYKDFFKKYEFHLTMLAVIGMLVFAFVAMVGFMQSTVG